MVFDSTNLLNKEFIAFNTIHPWINIQKHELTVKLTMGTKNTKIRTVNSAIN